MKSYTIITWGIILFTSALTAGEPKGEPEELASLRILWVEAKKRESRLVNKKYLASLTKTRVNLTKAGRLEQAVSVHDEILRISQERQPVEAAEEAKNAPPELARLRSQYDREISKITAAVNQKYLGALKKLRQKYSKKAMLEEALALDAEIKKLTHTTERPVPTAEDALRKALLNGIWIYRMPNGIKIKLEFNSDGTIKVHDTPAAAWKWEIKDANSIWMVIWDRRALYNRVKKGKLEFKGKPSGYKSFRYITPGR